VTREIKLSRGWVGVAKPLTDIVPEHAYVTQSVDYFNAKWTSPNRVFDVHVRFRGTGNNELQIRTHGAEIEFSIVNEATVAAAVAIIQALQS
jgi:hypothetical protein